MQFLVEFSQRDILQAVEPVVAEVLGLEQINLELVFCSATIAHEREPGCWVIQELERLEFAIAGSEGDGRKIFQFDGTRLIFALERLAEAKLGASVANRLKLDHGVVEAEEEDRGVCLGATKIHFLQFRLLAA